MDFPPRGCCKWPHGHPIEKDFYWCRKPVQDPQSDKDMSHRDYCPEHHAVAHPKRRIRSEFVAPVGSNSPANFHFVAEVTHIEIRQQYNFLNQ